MPSTISLAHIVQSETGGLHRPTFARVSRDALAQNFRAFRKLAGSAKIMAVVKADGYGHGLIACSKIFAELGTDYFGVGFVEEGIALRQAGITTPILVLGGIVGSQIDLFLNHDLDLTASSVFKLEAINESARALKKHARVHLKIDTGMNRIGQNFRTADRLLDAAVNSNHIEIAGIYSHFATAEDTETSFAEIQLQRFMDVLGMAESLGIKNALRHIANSAGAIRFPESRLDMIRPGLGLYGQHGAKDLQTKFPLTPAMTLASEIVYTKRIRKGDGVSYGLKWIAPQDSWIATVPVGYGDGYPRHLSGKANVLIGGKRYPIVGAICMDQFMVNLGEDRFPGGSEVVLWGKQGNEEITLLELCELGGFIPYELPIYLTGRVPRVYS